MQKENTILKLDINLLIPNKYQPRKEFDETELANLSESIKLYGILNPILTREIDGKYEIIAGERRYRAAKLAGLTEVPVILKEATDDQMAEIALIENIQRKELSPIEEAKSYDEIIKLSNQTQEELAKKLGKSQSFVANKIRLLALPTEIQDALATKKISERHARSLLTVDSKEAQIELLNKIINEKLTVKETEQIIHQKEITEEEIKQAINDIMKSLNITNIDEEEKEEKEDDNMNNGNFFPSYDSNNASLNMMNMQSMNNNYMEPQNDIVMPTPNIISSPMEMNTQPMEQQFINPAPQMNMQQPVAEMPMGNTITNNNEFNNQPTNVMPEFIGQPTMAPVAQVEPVPAAPIMPEPVLIQPEVAVNPEVSIMPEVAPVTVGPEMIQPVQEPTTVMQDTPLFNPNAFEVPVTTEPIMSEPVLVTPVSPVMPEPVLNQPETMVTPTIIATPEVVDQPQVIEPLMNEPITLEPVIETQDNLSKLQELLNSNGYEYKVYSNDTTHCVILELSKN